MRGDGGWLGRVRDVGEAFLGVLRAELAELMADLGRSGRALVKVLVLVAVVAAIGFWSLGLLLYLAVELVALVLPRWGAVAAVLGLFVAVAVILLLVVRRKLGAIETPAETMRRRCEDHQRWWREQIAGDEPSGDGPGDGADD